MRCPKQAVRLLMSAPREMPLIGARPLVRPTATRLCETDLFCGLRDSRFQFFFSSCIPVLRKWLAHKRFGASLPFPAARPRGHASFSVSLQPASETRLASSLHDGRPRTRIPPDELGANWPLSGPAAIRVVIARDWYIGCAQPSPPRSGGPRYRIKLQAGLLHPAVRLLIHPSWRTG